jgi:integrase
MTDKPIAALVADYLDSCRARGLSSKTVALNRFVLNRLVLPVLTPSGVTTPADLDPRAVDKVLAHWRTIGGPKGPLSPASIHAYGRALNHFLAWLKEDGHAVNGKAKLAKLPKRDIDVLSRQDIDRLEDAAARVRARDALIIRVLADTGIRVGELVSLAGRDVLTRDGNHYLRVHGKGSKDRLVPLAPALHKRLDSWARGRPEEQLFVSVLTERGGSQKLPLTVSGVQQLVRILGQDVLGRRVHPHIFRHSFATWALTRGMNPVQLADILGHADTTMISRVYAHLSPSDAHKALMAALQG